MRFAEGLAVGVSFGAIGSTEKATFEAARNLAIGIGKFDEFFRFFHPVEFMRKIVIFLLNVFFVNKPSKNFKCRSYIDVTGVS